MYLILLSLLALSILAPIGALVHAASEPRRDSLWGRALAGVVDHPSPYRALRQAMASDQREPRVVRAAAVLSALLGGMAVPGGLAGLSGLVAAAIVLSEAGRHPFSAGELLVLIMGLSVPSGMVVAIRSLRLFGPLLRNVDGVVERARSLALHSFAHNAILLGIYLCYLLAVEPNPVVIGFAVYCVVSLVHVVLLNASADAIERARREHEAYVEAAGVDGPAIGAAPAR